MNLRKSALPLISAAALLTFSGVGAAAASAVEPAQATPVIQAGMVEENKPSYWASVLTGMGYTDVSCTKPVEGLSTSTWVSNGSYALVVVKAGSPKSVDQVNAQYWGVTPGQTVSTATGKAISHIIVCTGTKPSKPSTSTTNPVTTSTSTTTKPATSTVTTTVIKPVTSTVTTTKAAPTVVGQTEAPVVVKVVTVPSKPVVKHIVPASKPAKKPVVKHVAPASKPAKKPVVKHVAPAPAPLSQLDTPALAHTGASTAAGSAAAFGLLAAGAAFVVVSRRRG